MPRVPHRDRRGRTPTSTSSPPRDSPSRWRLVRDLVQLAALPTVGRSLADHHHRGRRPADGVLRRPGERAAQGAGGAHAPHGLDPVCPFRRGRHHHDPLPLAPCAPAHPARGGGGRPAFQRRDGIDAPMAMYAARAAQGHVGLAPAPGSRRGSADPPARRHRARREGSGGWGTPSRPPPTSPRSPRTSPAPPRAERDTAERQRLMETLGADQSARTQPPHIRVADPRPWRGSRRPGPPARLARRPRPFASSTCSRSTATRSSCTRVPPWVWSTRTTWPPSSCWLRRYSPGAAPARHRRDRHGPRADQPSTSTRCSRSRPWPCPCAFPTDPHRAAPTPGPPLSPRPEGRVGGHPCSQPGYGRCMRLTGRPLAAAALALALGLSGCTLIGGGPSVEPDAGASTPKTPQTPPSGSEALARYYGQDLSWSEVPGRSVRRPHRAPRATTSRTATPSPSRCCGCRPPGRRAGSGPWSSTLAAPAARAWTTPVQQTSSWANPCASATTLSGSTPAASAGPTRSTASTDRQLDQFLGADPTPDTPEEEKASRAPRSPSPTACKTNAGPLLGHVSTVDAAKDMDILRAALGDAKLNYLGKSYGTYLGTVYADLFPKLVGPVRARRGRAP